MTQENAIEVRNLTKSFDKGARKMSLSAFVNGKLFKSGMQSKFKALDNINFEVKKGSFFGIIGANGSGKSTLLRILLGSIPADKGSTINRNGRMVKLAMGMGFNNQLTARDNIYINGSIIGMSFQEIGESFDKILKFADVEEFVDFQLKNFSSGMRARLAFSIAMHTKADILLLDEFFGGVGDLDFKRKSEKAFRTMVEDGKTIVLVSHSFKLIESNCDEVLVLNKGKQIGIGPAKEMVDLYTEVVDNKKKKKDDRFRK